ncbi:L-type lectin-domain containing receptor kinase VIII.1 [Cucumis melo var. makuwa]|uniref:L-type lectin-domain containing receptor kinase VIII.1 n=1 Tax=Cucumis melo var. makuwa TaxID=1194695 RepID=A0A5A7U3E9_CUCMM|nr:L-type lectin-domain containing receptor kinase VIII.1 [Cucumis melo var. makuwa]
MHDKSLDATVAIDTMGYYAPEYFLTRRATKKKPTCLTSTSTRLNPRIEKMTTAVDGIHFSPPSPFSYPVNCHRPPLYPVLRLNRRSLQFPTLSLTAVLHPFFSISSSPQSPHKYIYIL